MSTVAIIPAYNEAPRIGKVLTVVTQSAVVDEVLVVDDGSRDGTGTQAKEFPVRLLTHSENRGKGAALQTGLEAALSNGADRLVFLDADLLGLDNTHISQLLAPLENPLEPRMVVGVFRGGRTGVDLAQRYFSILNGQRGLTRAMAERLPDLSWARFGVEVLMNLHTRKKGLDLIHVPLYGISHVTKEQKLGFVKGFLYRLQMYKEAIYAWRNYDRIVG